jgi:hypothetical protein
VYRLQILIAAAATVAGVLATNSFAQNATYGAAPPADLHPPIKLDAYTLRAQLMPGHLGLKPQSGAAANDPGLPFGMNYDRDTKGLVIPLDQKSEWGVGIGLNINSSATVEISPGSTLGLQRKRAPGLMLHKAF